MGVFECSINVHHHAVHYLVRLGHSRQLFISFLLLFFCLCLVFLSKLNWIRYNLIR